MLVPLKNKYINQLVSTSRFKIAKITHEFLGTKYLLLGTVKQASEPGYR